MSKPYIHAMSSVRKFGGVPGDYEPIHSFMDSSKAAIADNRHRVLTHTSWFISTILERIKFANSGPETSDHRFPTIINSSGRVVSIRDIGEQHVMEDFAGKFIPTPQDYIAEMEFKKWMQNGIEKPPSFLKIESLKKVEKISLKEIFPEPTGLLPMDDGKMIVHNLSPTYDGSMSRNTPIENVI